MTLKDIAKEAGVSISTVSRVINHGGNKAASKEVQERIWALARKYNYVPNAAARKLKTGDNAAAPSTSRQLACIFARVSDPASDQFFSSLAGSVEREAFRQNYILKHSFTSFDLNKPETYRLLSDSNVAGAVVLGRCDKPMIKFLRKNFNYVVYCGLNPFEANYDQIICSGYEAGKYVTEYLIGLKHKNIAYIGETQNESRYYGYLDALSEHGIALDRDYIAEALLTKEDGYRAAQKLILRQTDITAVFCCNDNTAIGVLRAFKEAGISIPGEISVISIDDIDMAQYVTPMLTTLHIPTDEMGRHAAKMLIDRINGGHTLPIKIDLPFHLTRRESVRELR